MAVTVQDETYYAAHVVRQSASRPTVTRAAIGSGGIVSSLEKLAKEWQAQREQCTTLLTAAQYQFLPVEAPNVPPSELKPAISWILRDMVEFPIEEATVDVVEIPVDKAAATQNRTMYAVVAHSKTIKDRQELFGQARLPLSVIDIPEMAQRNMASLVESPGRALAMLSFDSDGSLLTVTHAGELYLARRIDVTLAQLFQPDAASSHERVTLEVQRSLDHFDRQHHHMSISKLVLAPIGEDGGILREYLAANLDIPVEALKLDTIFDVSQVPELKNASSQQRLFLTLGAALRHEGRSL
jgi:MSHA biogenesis protein MshI